MVFTANWLVMMAIGRSPLTRTGCIPDVMERTNGSFCTNFSIHSHPFHLTIALTKPRPAVLRAGSAVTTLPRYFGSISASNPCGAVSLVKELVLYSRTNAQK